MPSTQRFGDVKTQHGDLCAQRAVTLNAEKGEHEVARRSAISDLTDGHDFVYEAVPGKGLQPIDRSVYEYLKKKSSR